MVMTLMGAMITTIRIHMVRINHPDLETEETETGIEIGIGIIEIGGVVTPESRSC
jgi:hypothetical protein